MREILAKWLARPISKKGNIPWPGGRFSGTIGALSR